MNRPSQVSIHLGPAVVSRSQSPLPAVVVRYEDASHLDGPSDPAFFGIGYGHRKYASTAIGSLKPESAIISYLIPNRSIPTNSPLIHSCEHGDIKICIIVDQHFFFALDYPVQPTCILG
jgi:hypothetical protein